MSQADNLGPPSAPNIYAIYRGFYVLPSDKLDQTVVRIDFFVSRSPNGMGYEGNQVFAYGDNATGMYAVHTGLDENTYYAYRCQYVCLDGSKTPIGDITEAGQAQLSASSDLNIDQLASRAYSTGLITSGTFQGVIFRTSPVDPKVQMDPTGIWAHDGSGRTTFYLHADGSDAYFSGQIDLQESSAALDPATPSEVSWGGEVLVNTSEEEDTPGTWQDIVGGAVPGGWTFHPDDPSGSNWSTWVGPLLSGKYAGAGADDASNGGTQAWSNPGNIAASGDASAHGVGNNPLISHYLKSSSHGFSIPLTATIAGISLTMSRVTATAFFVPFTSDNKISLVKAGTVQTTNRSTGASWSTTYTEVTFGSSSDLWGTTWTPTDINNSGFGAALAVNLYSNDCRVDWFRIDVYYIDGGKTDQLVTTNYGFGLPPNASIKGIQLNLTSQTNSSNVHDSNISLVKGGVVQATNKATNTWVNGISTLTFGNATDLWGTTWSPADVNSSGFGAAISVLDTVDTDYESFYALLFNVSLIIYYQVLQLGTNSEWIQGALSGGHHALMAGAGNQQVTIIDDVGNSSFLLGNKTAATVYRNAAWTSGAAVNIKVLFDTVEYDLGGNFDSLNHRYSVPVAGVYSVKLLVGVTATNDLVAILYKNGGVFAYGTETVSTANDYSSNLARDVQCNAGDYLEGWVYTNPSVSGQVGANAAYMSIVRVA